MCGVHHVCLWGWCTSCCLCRWCTSCVSVWVVYIMCSCVGGVYHVCLCGWCTSCVFVSAVWAKNGRKSIDDFSYNKGNTGQSCWLDWNRNARDRSVQLLLYSSAKTSTLCKTCHWINQLLLLLEISKKAHILWILLIIPDLIMQSYLGKTEFKDDQIIL